MAATFTGTSKCNLDLTYNQGLAGIGSIARIQASSTGANAAVVPDFVMSYGTGTVLDSNGAVNVNSLYQFQGTIASLATKAIDLTGGSDNDVFGVQLAFAVIKYVLVAIITPAPDGVNYVKVGPQGIANSAQLWFGGTTSAAYEAVYWSQEWRGPAAGYTVTAGTGDLFQVTNAAGVSLTVLIVIAGKK